VSSSFYRSQAVDESKRSESDSKRLAKVLGSSHLSVAVDDVRVIREGKKKRTSAKIYLAHAKSDFYNPLTVLIEQFREEAEADAMTSEGRQVDPSAVVATPPDASGHSHPTGRGKFWYLARRRVRSVAGPEYLTAWRASHVVAGYFFLYRDRVLLVTHSHADGWRQVVVPPAGLEVSPMEWLKAPGRKY